MKDTLERNQDVSLKSEDFKQVLSLDIQIFTVKTKKILQEPLFEYFSCLVSSVNNC